VNATRAASATRTATDTHRSGTVIGRIRRQALGSRTTKYPSMASPLRAAAQDMIVSITSSRCASAPPVMAITTGSHRAGATSEITRATASSAR
jgi:hypothetical protein